MTRPRKRLQAYEPPRGITAGEAAHLLGLNESAFSSKLKELQKAGFPDRDPLTLRYDRKAIDLWLDRRSGIATSFDSPSSTDASDKIKEWRESA